MAGDEGRDVRPQREAGGECRPATSEVVLRMPTVESLARFRVPLGGQEIELQTFVHEAGGMPLLRVRIRERSRFTVFDVDPVTARAWGEAMQRWGTGVLAVPSGTPECERSGGNTQGA